MNTAIYKSRYETLPPLVEKLSEPGQEIRGVEIGVREGFHCFFLLKRIPDLFMQGIDINHCETSYNLLGQFGARYKEVTGHSPGIASEYPDGYFDFIHIDADHSYMGCRQDLDAWWPKLRQGGLFSGDDFSPVECNVAEGKYGVVEAVTEFVDKYGLKLRVTGVDSDDREAQLTYAGKQGKLIDEFFKGGPQEYDIPNWYLYK